jgi:hypothetical protein
MNIDLARSSAGDAIYGLRDMANAYNCSIVILHHLNKSGGLRDSTSFVDNVSEVVKLTRAESFDPNEFTIEWFMWFDMLAGHTLSCDILSNNITGGLGMRCAQAFDSEGLSSLNPKYFNVFARNQADLDYWTLPGNWPVNQWVFCALQRKGTDMCFWLDGQLCTRTVAGGGAGTRSFNTSTSATDVRIGRANGAAGIAPGYIDELCFSNTYRYENITQNIPVPYQPFTVDSFTSQLLHMDGANTGTIFTNALT